ncbi:hypothetical protein HanRHA438_Chr05g0225921 [Helianthus annuus]|nr:hypothetical protein HanRHA438_Chr05g0225921 [Helianthus annuus]
MVKKNFKKPYKILPITPPPPLQFFTKFFNPLSHTTLNFFQPNNKTENGELDGGGGDRARHFDRRRTAYVDQTAYWDKPSNNTNNTLVTITTI